MSTKTVKPKILYSCYYSRSREGEHFIPEHVFSYQISGDMIASDTKNTFYSKEGDFRFSRRNHLAKFTKIPPQGGEFKTISLYLDQEILLEVSREYNLIADKKVDSDAMLTLKPHPLYKSFMESLLSYLEVEQENNETLFNLKIKEAIHLLLKLNPELKDILFDFNEPGKIDLEAFMNKNFHFNVQMHRFAYLTGRSLATFKRDFQKTFDQAPGKWLLNKRLQEAYYLITQGKSPSEVYIGVGFEDLSHFSFSFKKKFGITPSSLNQK